MQVLIITTSSDPIEHVTRALIDLGAEPVRLDTDRFPAALRLSMYDDGRLILRDGDTITDLSAVDAVWYRRMLVAAPPLAPEDRQLAAGIAEEVRSFLRGLVASRPVFVLDPKWRIARADLKPRQLAVAAACGLEVPETCTATLPDAVRAWADGVEGELVTKVYSSFAVRAEGEERVVFTSPVAREELAELDGLDLCPATFQARVPKERELRVTIVGDELFVASVDSAAREGAEVDWRRRGHALARSWRRDELPAEVSAALLRLMDVLQLNYGAADIIRTPDGRHVFLEVNPAGEHIWVDRVFDGAIGRAIAELLVGRRRRR